MQVALFALCMGGLMYYREHEPATMAPFLNTLISRIVFGQTKRDRPAMPRPSSIYFSHSDLPVGHARLLVLHWGVSSHSHA